MSLPLGHTRDYMRLVSSQLSIPQTQEIDAMMMRDSLTDIIAANLALKQYETARRAAIAMGRRMRFAVVGSNPSDPCNMIDVKRGFGRRAAEEFERGY